MTETRKRKKTGRVALIACAALAAVILVYLLTGNYAPSEEAKSAMESNANVAVTETDAYIIFAPEGKTPETGFVFYPGGKVDSRAYASVMQNIAERGALCIIVKMPFNLAVFNINGADGAIAMYPAIKNWTIGGHSLGGVMACEWAKKHTDSIKGIAFWAAYANSDLSASGLACVSVSADRDGLLDRTKYEEAKALLPQDARYEVISGGNHSQFGSYGLQKGDGSATLSAVAQEKLVAEITWQLLEMNE